MGDVEMFHCYVFFAIFRSPDRGQLDFHLHHLSHDPNVQNGPATISKLGFCPTTVTVKTIAM